ncbi:hypothetical protein L218DRAFT_971406 [Marasmius fiardii PR-910]|nr:hypothetical protein L218DRAFT_971406 [Marasmius fiardii PR-910]
MPPKRNREKLARQVNASIGVEPELVAKRTKRHLDELERSNYSESAAVNDGEEGYTKGRARQPISDKRNLNLTGNSPAAKKKKSTMNVRSALLYRKNFATLLEESKIASLPTSIPTYLTAQGPPPRYPARMVCSVCGYWGLYKCRKCAMPFCDRNCENVHEDTRCERRVL